MLQFSCLDRLTTTNSQVNSLLIFLSNLFPTLMIDPSSQKLNSSCSRTRTEQPLYEAAQLQQKTVSALRAAFNHWIRTLPMQERFLALKVSSVVLPHTIRRFFSKFEESAHERCIYMQVGKCEPTREEAAVEFKRIPRKIQKGFYDSLVFVTDGHGYLDHICFEFGLLECPQKLFDLLMATFDANGPKPMFEALKNRTSPEAINERIMKIKTKEQAMYEILNFLRQEVLLRFREAMLDCQFISRSLDLQKRRKKQFNTYWKHLSQELRNNLLHLNHPNISELHKWLTVNDIFMNKEELKLEIEQLLKLEKNDFCNRIFKCKFKKSITPIIDYYQLVYQLWRKEMEKNKKKKGQKYISNEKDVKTIGKTQVKERQNGKKNKTKETKAHRKSNSLQSNETNVTDNEKMIERHLTKSEMHLQKEEEFHEYCKFTTEKQELEPEREKQKKSAKQEKNKNKGKNNGKIKNQPRQKEKCEMETAKLKFIETSQDKFQSSLINPQKNKVSLTQLETKKYNWLRQQLRQAELIKLSQQLQDMSDKTSQEANKYHDRRVVAFERIQFLLAFYNISIRLFGSCASGIAIKNSDIDVAVDNSILSLYDYLPENLKLLGALESLEQVFASQPCFTYLKLISTASIPVIKLTIDTSLEFLNPNYGEVYYSLNRKHFSGPIEADITIQTVNKLSQCNHLGLISTEAINQWLSQISSLHTIVMFMKQIFKNHRFNITYQGGLNTFAMIVLLVSYIRHAKLEEQSNSAIVLEKILRFYSEEFDEKQYGIDLLRHKKSQIFYKKETSKNGTSKDAADLQILDPKCQGKNMTRNCYQFNQIKKLFKEILVKCYEQPFKQSEKVTEGLGKCNKEVLFEKVKKINENRNVFIDFLTI